MQAASAQVAQSNGDPARPASTARKTTEKAIDLTNTVASIVKEVAEVLQHAPYVKTLSGVILQFIKIREELKMNKERCREIIDKVLNLSHWIYEKLATIAKFGERVKENLAQVESSLNFCTSTLTNVLEELQKHQSRPKLVKFISRGLEDLNKLDRSVDNLEKRLVRDIMFDIKLQQGIPTRSENTDPTSLVHDHVLPPKPYLMVERQAQIDSALNILLDSEPSRIAILGGGGFGKTTLALSLLHEPNIAERYTARFFLSCEGVANVEALLLEFGSMLGINSSPPTILVSARRILANSTTLLCLDNFETPWEPSTTRTEVEKLLASIAGIPNLSLIITTRGTERPSRVAWTHPLLPPLSTVSSESAQKILQTICGPACSIDEPTQNLLDAVDGIPLAITLISNLLRDGETSRALWTRWSKQHTKIIKKGGDDRESNLNTSIALSIHSPRTKDHGAITLLAALALLPDGFASAEIDQLEGCLGINEVGMALQILRAVALIPLDKANPSPQIQMLSPIRLFCLEFLSSDISLVFEGVVNYYIGIMFRVTDKCDNADLYAQVVPEIRNIHSVFQRAYQTGYSQDITRLINATSYLTHWSRYVGYVTQDTIQMAIKSCINFPIPYAKCLVSLGDLHRTKGQHTRAETCYREAAAFFKHGNDEIQEVWALYRLGDILIHMGQLDQAEVPLRSSLEIYTQADHKQEQAIVSHSLGKLYIQKGQYSEAESTLTSALEACKQISDLIGQSNAARDLTRLHFIRGNLVEAKKHATESLDAAKRANNALGEGGALWWLGRIYLALDRVPDAIQALKQTLLIVKQQNHPVNQLNTINDLAEVYIQSDQLCAAEALLTESAMLDFDVVQIPIILTTLGWLYICGNRLDKAEPLLDNALQHIRKFNRKDQQAEIFVYLGTVYLKSNRLDSAERALESIPDSDRSQEIEIHRLWVLGDIYIIKGELDDAKASLDAAMARCQNRQELYSYRQGNILRSMGTLHIKQGCVDRAIRAFKRAREFHRKAQWVSEQATDLKRLGEAYEMLERAEEAEAAFMEADELMESVRDARTLKD